MYKCIYTYISVFCIYMRMIAAHSVFIYITKIYIVIFIIMPLDNAVTYLFTTVHVFLSTKICFLMFNFISLLQFSSKPFVIPKFDRTNGGNESKLYYCVKKQFNIKVCVLRYMYNKFRNQQDFYYIDTLKMFFFFYFQKV